MIKIVEEAARRVGGITELSRRLGVKHPAFHSWTRVPAERVVALEAITGIPREELRPDLYRRLPEASKGLTGDTKARKSLVRASGRK